MTQITLYNSTTHESVVVDVPESIANDLENTVVINGFESFKFVSTIPEAVKQLREYEQVFEDAEFETIYKDLPTEGLDPKTIDSKFVEYFYNCIKEKYPELNGLEKGKKESVCLALCTRFSVFVFSKQKKIKEESKEVTSDLCFGEDYANRIIGLFKALSLDDAESILNFSTNLEKIEQSMLEDKRRRAGFDAMMLGLSTSIQDIASVFINDPNAENINLIEAFKKSTDSKDKDIIKGKLEKVINNSADYYQKYLQNVKNAISVIGKVDSNKPIAYLKVAYKLISDFVTDTRDVIAELNNLKGHSNVDDIRRDRTEGYRKVISNFSYSIDLLMTAFDHEKIEENEYGQKVVSAWKLYEKEKSSDNNTWYVTLANDYVAAWEDLFGCLKSL